MTQSLDTLEALVRILEEENRALLDNRHDEIASLAREKSRLVTQLGKGNSLLDDPAAMPLLQKCESLNRSNGSAISAALSRTRKLLENIAPPSDHVTTGYSAKGLHDSVSLAGRSFGRV